MDKTNMTKKFRRIAILTAGGDAPGMNPCFRALTRAIIASGVEAIGVRGGYRGLIENDMVLLDERSVSNIINIGGTALYTDRCKKFETAEGLAIAVENCRKNNIDGIICLGGDGTFRGARDLTALGVPCIGIPCTIDNDISSTDYTIGFGTALDTVIEMVDRLRDTCESHARCDVVKVMGNGSGYLAVHSGIAVGATAVITKEIPFDEDALIEKMLQSRANRKRNFIIIVSENMGKDFAYNLHERIDLKTRSDINDKHSGIETKYASLEHVQRGGSPRHKDRMIAAMMADKAVKLILKGESNKVICEQNGDIVSMDITFALDFDTYYKAESYAEMLERNEKVDYLNLDAKTIEKYRKAIATRDEIVKTRSPEEIAKMEEMAKRRREKFLDVYNINNAISN